MRPGNARTPRAAGEGQPPRDGKRTHRAKHSTVTRKQQRALKAARRQEA